MGWKRRLRTWFTGETAAAIPPDVAGMVAALREEAARIEDASARAPNAHAADLLAKIAAEDRASAARLEEALQARGLSAHAAASPAPAPQVRAPNHWGRLCARLEGHKALRARAVDLYAEVNEDDAELAELIDAILHREDTHIDELLDLIACADPQAMD